MTVTEGIGYLHGNLCRDWVAKNVQVNNEDKVIFENALAYQPRKDDPTTFVDLTVWPDQNNSTAEGEEYAKSSGKGTKVIIRGKFASDSYVSKEGQPKMGWKCSVWDLATTVRPPWNNNGQSNVVATFPGATQVVPAGHEPF